MSSGSFLFLPSRQKDLLSSFKFSTLNFRRYSKEGRKFLSSSSYAPGWMAEEFPQQKSSENEKTLFTSNYVLSAQEDVPLEKNCFIKMLFWRRMFSSSQKCDEDSSVKMIS